MAVAENRWAHRKKFIRKVEVYRHDASVTSTTSFLSSQKPEVCWSLDISTGGMRLETDKHFDPDVILKLNFQMLQKSAVNVFARVVWTHENVCGLKFMGFDARSPQTPYSTASNN